MKKYWYVIFVFSIFGFLLLECSNNNSISQSQKNKIGYAAGNKVTSGSSNISEDATETGIINSLKALNSTKFNSEMYDFSNPANKYALIDRSVLIEQIKKNPSILQKEEVKTALIDLLNNEVKYSREYYKNTHKGLGEGYGEYEATLSEIVYKFLDKRSLETMVILLGDTNGFLTTYWKDSSQLVLQRIKTSSDTTNILYQIAALGKAQKEKHFTLAPETIKSFKSFALTELKSPKSYFRRPAVEALQYITTKNDKEIIEALKIVAKSDPYRYYARPVYPVREAAKKALEYIEKQ